MITEETTSLDGGVIEYPTPLISPSSNDPIATSSTEETIKATVEEEEVREVE